MALCLKLTIHESHALLSSVGLRCVLCCLASSLNCDFRHLAGTQEGELCSPCYSVSLRRSPVLPAFILQLGEAGSHALITHRVNSQFLLVVCLLATASDNCHFTQAYATASPDTVSVLYLSPEPRQVTDVILLGTQGARACSSFRSVSVHCGSVLLGLSLPCDGRHMVSAY